MKWFFKVYINFVIQVMGPKKAAEMPIEDLMRQLALARTRRAAYRQHALLWQSGFAAGWQARILFMHIFLTFLAQSRNIG